MQIVILAAFALVLWLGTDYRPYVEVSSGAWTLLLSLIHPILVWVSAIVLSRAIVRRLRRSPSDAEPAQRLQSGGVLFLRCLLMGGFLFLIFGTDWVPLVHRVGALERLYGLRGMTVLAPFLVGLVLLWAGLYGADRELRLAALDVRGPEAAAHHTVWSFRRYLVFHLRHQLLIILMPMLPILISWEATRAYSGRLKAATGIFWAADGIVGIVAGIVFFFLPSALCWIWSTTELPAGPLHDRLRAVARRIGLRYRRILVWHTEGLVINAAVAGLLPPVRYVLLSDGLLETLAEDQVEAVFAHEAGHVKHHHIFFFLLFSLASMMVVGGVTLGIWEAGYRITSQTQQTLALVLLTLIWGFGFGWVSRRFERQADVYGVRCIAEGLALCPMPCRVHGEAGSLNGDLLCSTAADRFAETLHSVAELNGIPPEARSWRHSSIASRMRFLRHLAQAPDDLQRFDRLLWRIKAFLLVFSLVGGAITVKVYWPAELFGFDL